jgi:hypothetical protein
MLDIRFVRENPDAVKENIRKKFQDAKLPLVDEVIALDAEYRAAIGEASDLRANRNKLSKQIGSSRLSFATAEDLEQLLGVQPGSASVLGLLNDKEHRVILVLDRAVAESRWFGCHPCRNTSSLRLRTEDVLEKFLPHTGHVPLVVEF